jgi:hypothetical protein
LLSVHYLEFAIRPNLDDEWLKTVRFIRLGISPLIELADVVQ